jgi:Holliday junction resolvase YEN1
MDKAGLLLCVLLLGGDYASGVLGINPAIAHALAVQGFGQELVDIVTCSKASDLDENLSRWREAIRDELRTNSSGHLANHYLELADEIPDTFPDLKVVDSYMNPLTSGSPHYIGLMPDFKFWKPREPAVHQLSIFCSSVFGWHDEKLLKKFNSIVAWCRIQNAFIGNSKTTISIHCANNFRVSCFTTAKLK